MSRAISTRRFRLASCSSQLVECLCDADLLVDQGLRSASRRVRMMTTRSGLVSRMNAGTRDTVVPEDFEERRSATAQRVGRAGPSQVT